MFLWDRNETNFKTYNHYEAIMILVLKYNFSKLELSYSLVVILII